VTTIGLGHGYNEDLMFELARRSDGNHAFAEGASDLARIFSNELGDVLSVVAREVNVRIKCSSGIRPIRVLGRDADINGNTIVARLNQLYAEQEKYLLVEVEIPASPRGSIRKVASVDVYYLNAVSRNKDVLSGDISVRFSESMADVTSSRNEAVMVSTLDLVAAEQNRRAVILRDQGKTEQAKNVLMDNAAMLDKAAAEYKSPKLKRRARANRGDADNLAPARWKAQRKKMRDEQFEAEMQMAW
jgi:Ca-activated chloride channel family protein